MEAHVPSRPLTLSEQKQARELWSLAFPEDSEAFQDWFFATQFPALRSWSTWVKDKLLAVVYAKPYQLVCRGKLIPASFILGVATHPEARRRGFMRRLLQEVHEDLAQTCPAVCLHPFDFDFYRRLGYSTVSERLRVRLPAAALTHDEPLGTVETAPDFARLAAINQRHAERMGFFAVRDAALLSRRFADLQTGGGFCMMNEQAYAFIDPGPANTLPTDEPNAASDPTGVFLLSEFSYADFAAGAALLSALTESYAVSQLDFSLTLGDAPLQWPSSALTREPFLMLNGLDIPAFVTGMRGEVSSPSPISRVIRILDDDSRWRLLVDDSNTTLSPVSAHSDVHLTRDQFIRWVCGYSDADALAAEGVSNAECLSFFPKLSAFFFDMY